MNNSRIPHLVPRGATGGVNDTCNDTIVNVVATLNKEDNDRSETGGDDFGSARRNACDALLEERWA